MSLLVKFSEQVNRFEVLSPTVSIGNPLALFAGVIEIEHRCDGIDSQTINVVFLEPEQGIGDQEVSDFVSPEVEDHRPPIGMLALSWIFMFVQRRPVKSTKPVVVLRKVGWHPIDNNSDPILMAVIDEVHEVIGDP